MTYKLYNTYTYTVFNHFIINFLRFCLYLYLLTIIMYNNIYHNVFKNFFFAFNLQYILKFLFYRRYKYLVKIIINT
jgi:hypothetical protein